MSCHLFIYEIDALFPDSFRQLIYSILTLMRTQIRRQQFRKCSSREYCTKSVGFYDATTTTWRQIGALGWAARHQQWAFFYWRQAFTTTINRCATRWAGQKGGRLAPRVVEDPMTCSSWCRPTTHSFLPSCLLGIAASAAAAAAAATAEWSLVMTWRAALM